MVIESSIFKSCCNLFGPGKMLRRIFYFFRKDFLRIKIDRILSEPLREMLEIWPELSQKDRTKIQLNFGNFLDKNGDILFREWRIICALTPLCVQVICPNLTDENLQLLFELILEEVRERGKMFDRL